MSKKDTQRKAGRPKTLIDWSKVNRYLQAQCDGAAIAGLLGIHPDTLYRACERDNKMGFAAYSQHKKAEGQELLRAKMFSDAMAGDKTMQIWLSKQYLGMSDKHENILPEGAQDITVRVLRRGEKPQLIEPAQIIDELPAGGNGGDDEEQAAEEDTQ